MLFRRIIILKEDEMVIKTAEYEKLKQDSESLKRVYDRIAIAFRKVMK
jgi:hypothetical protein